MKFLAILRDSLYETKDFKLFYVLLGLSVLVTVAAASFWFPRLPTEEALRNNLGEDLRVSSVEVLADSWFTPHARYRFRVEANEGGSLVTGLSQAVRGSIKHHEAQRFEQRRVLGLEEVKFDGNMFGNPQAVFAAIEKARDASVDRKMKELLGEDHEQAARDPARLAVALLSTVPGIKQHSAEVAQQTPGNAALIVDADVNWAELHKSRRVWLLFGIWKFDVGDRSLGDFMASWIHKPLLLYLAGWVGIVLAVIITAGFVPAMMQKGTLDLLLVKPISRPMLLIYKYFGGLTFVFINAAVLVLGTWIAFGFTTGNWSPWYLLAVPLLTFYFAILYALSLLIGVLTRSSIAAVLITLGVWFILFLVSYAFTEIHRPVAQRYLEKEMPALVTTIDTIHLLLPKPGDVDTLNQFLILRANGSEELLAMRQLSESKFSWTETLSTSAAFIGVMLGLASWRFSRRDY